MKSATVFVSGGSGFLGSRLIPALRLAGYEVRALSRSTQSSTVVAERGAEPVTGDLGDVVALTHAMSGCTHVVHAAARQRDGGSLAAHHCDNVVGTQHMLTAAQAAGARRFVSVGAAMCLLGGKPIENADESWPLNEPRYSHYARTKTVADRAVLAANREGFATIVVRPGWFWGQGDPQTTSIVAAASTGRLRLIDSGQYPIVTSHIDNTVKGIELALQRGTGGQGYYVFDDGAIPLRDFIERILAAHRLPAPTKTISRRAAWITATVMDTAWTILRRPGQPPISRLMVTLNSGPFLVTDHKARRQLQYAPIITREDAFAALTH